MIDGVKSLDYAEPMMDHTGDSNPELRRRLLDAAREILAEPDTGLDLRKIAERAGKSRTAPYLVFGKTEDGGGLAALRLAVAAEGFDELVGALEEELQSAPDVEEGLERLAAAYLAFARDHPRLFRLMFGPEVGHEMRGASSSAHRSPPLRREHPAARPEHRELRAAHERLERTLLSAIVRQAPGYLQSGGGGDARTMTGALWALLHGVATLTIDEQWGITRLAGAGADEDPDLLAQRTLRFLTTASSGALKDVARALEAARRARDLQAGARSRARARPGDRHQAPRTDALASMLPVLERRGPEGEAHFVSETSAPYGPPTRAFPSSSSLERARARMDLAQGARVVWIDDDPRSVWHETAMLEGLGAHVYHARDARSGATLARKTRADVILSDIARGGDREAGVKALPELRRAAGAAPVIFYVRRLDPGRPPPAGAFGITNDPDELLHLVFDVLERKEGREGR
jgi:CheY-like chemotaxis protein